MFCNSINFNIKQLNFGNNKANIYGKNNPHFLGFRNGIYNNQNDEFIPSSKSKVKKLISEEEIIKLPCLARFNLEDRKKIAQHVTQANYRFLPKIAGLENDFEGGYTEFGIGVILDSINEANCDKFEPLLTEDLNDKNLLPYEVINRYLPNRSSSIRQSNMHLRDNIHIASCSNIERHNVEKKPITSFNQDNYLELIKLPEYSNLLELNEEQEEKYNRAIHKFYDNCFKEIHTEKSTNPDAIAVENKLKNLGVKVNLANDFETGEAIYNVISNLNSRGVNYPREFILMTPFEEQVQGYTPYMPDKNLYSKRPIFIKKNLELPSVKIEDNSNLGFLRKQGIEFNATKSKEGVIAHEIGHWLHAFKELPAKEAISIWKNEANDGFDLELAKEVSFYAMTGDKFHCGREYIAEMFAGMNDGIEYSDRAMKLYRDLGGPEY